MKTPDPRMLSFAEEKAFEKQGYQRIAGIDEAGRGALAGPVVASAIVMPYHAGAPWFPQINDSKVLNVSQRELLYHNILETALAIGIGMVFQEAIDLHGIVWATRLAMRQAVEQISPAPDFLLIDYLRLPDVKLPHKGIVDGDATCFSIASASIVAKVTRDRLMKAFDEIYPGYGLAHNKGYGTREHVECLERLGACAIHRRSFTPVKELIQGRLFRKENETA